MENFITTPSFTNMQQAVKDFPCQKPLDNADKWRITLYTAVIFFVVSAPFLYILVDKTLGRLLGFRVASSSGCPTLGGLFIHTVVFTLIVRALMGW